MKKVLLIGLLLLPILAFSVSAAGCCINPLADEDYFCNAAPLGLPKSLCCPSNDASFYYDEDTQPYGPETQEECESNYYVEGVSCSVYTLTNAVCESIWCCSGDVKFETERGICEPQYGVGAVYSDEASCDIALNSTPTTNCADATTSPVISDITVVPVKGEKQMTIEWSDTCVAGEYRIQRCLDNNCIEIGRTANRTITDTSPELLWDTTYTYKISGAYTPTRSVANTRSAEGNLGDIECWGHYDTEKFCLHLRDYTRPNVKSYLMSTNSVPEANYVSWAETTYDDKFNAAYRCNRFNRHTDPALLVCSDPDVCVVNGGEPTCAAPGLCEPDFTDNPFGLYTSADECRDLGYCYPDTSNTVVDACYACSSQLECYDYASEGACTADRCGISTCAWKDIIPELGVGVCIDTTADNCPYCTQASPAHNSLLAACTPEKANALSTTSGQCYYTGGTAISCDTASCLDLYVCSDQLPSMNADNTLVDRGAACGLNACQLILGECRKNGDGDSQPDCSVGDTTCEGDVYPPSTVFEPIDDDGITIGYRIRVTDRTATGNADDPTYTTKLCIDPPGSSVCATTPGRQFGLSANDNQLSINGLLLAEWNTDNPLSLLGEGTNTIYYYSVDSSGNLGQVRSVSVVARESYVRPEIFSITFGGREADENNAFYINTDTPQLIIKLRDGGALLETVQLSQDGTLLVDTEEFVINPTPTLTTTEYTVTLPQGFTVDEGDYTLFINGKNDQDIAFRTSQRTYDVHVSFASLSATITPPPPALLTEQRFDLSITFPADVNLTTATISGEDILSDLDPGFQTSFGATLTLPDGVKNVYVDGVDRFGNTATGTATFEINAQPPGLDSVWIASPRYGVSTTNTFDVVLESDNAMECRYRLLFPATANDFDRMATFNEGVSTVHTISDVTVQDGEKIPLYVLCKDEAFRTDAYLYEFELSVDRVAPQIIRLYANPNPVGEGDVNVTMTVLASEPVRCRYDGTDRPYRDMQERFEDLFENDVDNYQIQKIAKLYVDSFSTPSSDPVYVACEDRAGTVSATTSFTLVLDPSLGLTITSTTPRYQGNASPIVSLGTSKRADCYYSLTDPQVARNPTRLSSADQYRHNAQLRVNLTSADYTIHTRCIARTESASLSIPITVDVTPPQMLYVNDTSLIASAPEFTAYPDKIYVTWKGEDNDSGSEGLIYNYTLLDPLTGDPAIDWTNRHISIDNDNEVEQWINKDDQGVKLNLSDDTRYIFKVKSANILGQWSSEMSSDGVTTDFSLSDEASCSNGITDGSESDVDCGGSCGPTCQVDDTCNRNSDCASSYCTDDDVCAEALCTDDVKNGDETDIDCGGDECDECEIDDRCIVDSDCESDYCRNGLCSERNSCEDGQLSTGETDIDCGGICPNRCRDGQYCETNTDCLSGLDCRSGVCTVRESTGGGGGDGDGDGIPDDWERANGLDPEDPNDAQADYDDDGLSNAQEWQYGTDPNNNDTDGDKYDDGVEVAKGTSPTDPNDKPTSIWKIIILVIMIILVLGGIGYLVYVEYYQKRKTPPTRPRMAMQQPMQQRPYQPAMKQPKQVAAARDKRRNQRHSLLSAFVDKPGEKKTGDKSDLKKLPEKEEKESDSKPAKKTEGTTIKTPPEKKAEDPFEKLKKLSGTSTSGLDKVKKLATDEKKPEPREDLHKRLEGVEKKVGALTKDPAVYCTPSGTKYHKPTCITLKKYLKSELDRFVSSAAAKKAKKTPCSVCHPKK